MPQAKKKQPPKKQTKALAKVVAQPKSEPLLGSEPNTEYDRADVDDRATVTPPKAEDLKRLSDLADQQIALTKRIAKGQELLAELQDQLKRLSEVDLPEAMSKVGMKQFILTDGYQIEVKTVTQARIPVPLISEAHAFLEAHGNGGLIKRRIQIFFGREDQAWARKFIADCEKRKKPLQLEQKEWVDPQTLSAWAREQARIVEKSGGNLEDLVPAKLFGVFKQTYAKITPPEKQ